MSLSLGLSVSEDQPWPWDAANLDTLFPALFAETEIFYSPVVVGARTLTAGLFTGDETFYGSVISLETVDLTPSLFTETEVFYGGVITGPQVLVPGLFTGVETFYGPTMGLGSLGLSAILFTDTETIYSPTVELVDGFTLIGQTTFTAAVGTGEEAKTLPGPILENDIVFVALCCDNILSISTEGLQTSNGYTIIYDTASLSSPAAHIGYKVMGATPDSTVTIGQEGLKFIAGVIQVWRGQDLTTPIDVTSTGPDTANTGDPTNPAITTVTNDALVLLFACVDSDDAVTVTAPSGYSNTVFGNTGQSSTEIGATTMLASKILTTAGLETPGIWAASSSDKWLAVTVALRPA
jgi:hypothetical protein